MHIETLARTDAPVASTRFSVQLATRSSMIDAALRLRYKVFCEEMGADIERHDGRDIDEFDALCEHLVVIDEWREKVVGTYRILPPWGAHRLGKRYAESEFRMDALRPIHKDLYEVGRACVHPAYREGEGGMVLARLWTGLGAYVRENRVRYLAGCASVPLERGALNLGAMRAELLSKHLAPEDYRVEPIRGLPHLGDPEGSRPAIPPLLKGYLRLGAWICGEAAWDPCFDTADYFVLLPVERIAPRYARHFLGTATAQ
ncbi:MAG: GNAT family N-acetyltransferase [Casimicrobium sp.]